jgi:DMSO/TMAO reductase YedYZ molybdopterin-dependent catalytic subunit
LLVRSERPPPSIPRAIAYKLGTQPQSVADADFARRIEDFMATTYSPDQTVSQPHHQSISLRLAGRAGATAAGIMLAVQLIWRLNWSTNGVVQAFPEFIVAAISRLTPLSIFGAATENYGGNAKKLLFVVVLLGVILIGRQAGVAAARISNQIGAGVIGRFLSALIVSALLYLFTNLVILPIAYLGVFATRSSYTSDILTQLTLTFLLFAVVWVVLTAQVLEEGTMTNHDGSTINRRTLITRSAATAVPAATVIALGGGTWKLLNPKTRETTPLVTNVAPGSTATVDEVTVQEIVATQRANQGYDLDEETPPDNSESSFVNEPREVAELQSDQAASPEADDPFALYNQLEANGQLTPVLTETDDFYHVSKNLSDPRVSSDGWALSIDGLVDNPLTFDIDQLTALATTHKITTLGCISNEINGDLIGTAEWIGVPLMDLLNQAGVQTGVVKLKMHAADDYEDSISLERGMDPDTMVVVGMNGETLRDDHGYPARLIVPGIYGMKNVKWLDRIEAINDDFQGYWQTRGWSDPAPFQIWGRIDYPKSVINPGPNYADGVASAGDRDVSRVEVSLDNGETWADAQIEPSLNPPLTWVRWAYAFNAEPDTDFTIKIRVTDGLGTVMEEDRNSPLPDGATGWPSRKISVQKE